MAGFLHTYLQLHTSVATFTLDKSLFFNVTKTAKLKGVSILCNYYAGPVIAVSRHDAEKKKAPKEGVTQPLFLPNAILK